MYVKKLKVPEDSSFLSLLRKIFLERLTSYATSVYFPTINTSVKIVPMSPPTYEKNASNLLKERVYVTVFDDFLKIRFARPLNSPD